MLLLLSYIPFFKVRGTVSRTPLKCPHCAGCGLTLKSMVRVITNKKGLVVFGQTRGFVGKDAILKIKMASFLYQKNKAFFI